jgi:transposase
MHPKSPSQSRRVHGAEFKAQVLAACREPGASVSAVAIAHGLNTNLVRKWLQGRGLKRAGLAPPAAVASAAPALQFVPVSLVAGCDPTPSAPPQRDFTLQITHGALQVSLHCSTAAAPAYAAMLRALADLAAGGPR